MSTIRAVCLCLFLVLAGTASGQSPPDGFYRLSSHESTSSVLAQDGRRLPLGEAQPLAIEISDIHSEDNANSRFWARVSVPYDRNFDAASLVLVVSGRGYPWAGSGSGPDLSSVEFAVSGASNAEDVARFLKTPIVYRRHPGHQLLVSFIPTQERFRIGDDVVVALSITNIGPNTIAFMQGGAYRGSTRDNQYEFSARRLGSQVPDIGTNQNFGGIIHTRSLGPGEKFEDTVSLSKWFPFDQAGRYEVLGSYYLRFVDPDGKSPGVMWTDYVTSDFVVRIDE